MTLAIDRLPEWQQFLKDTSLVGRELEVVTKHQNLFRRRGIIKKVWIGTKDRGGYLDHILCVQVKSWVAYDTREEVWLTLNTNTTCEIYIDYHTPTLLDTGEIELSPANTVRPQGDILDRSLVLTLYFVEVHVAHHLYPPHPFRDIKRVGTGRNINPERPKSQAEVTLSSLSFAIPARSYKAAEAWARAECARWGLRIVYVGKTHLLPGY